MIAPATRANLLSPIDKAAILASYEQGLFTVGHLSLLLDNYESLQEIARTSCDEPSLRDITEAELEAVAQAICDDEWDGSQPTFDKKPKSFGDRYRMRARAAIEAFQNSRKDGSSPK